MAEHCEDCQRSVLCPGIKSTADVQVVADALRLTAADVRGAGDMQLVRFTDDGVQNDITLSDYLWLLAVMLDGKLTPLRGPDEPPHNGSSTAAPAAGSTPGGEG